MKKVSIELELIDWWQVMDGLTCRAEQYELTVQYFETGFADREILGVRNMSEAQNIAMWYRQLIEKVNNQLS